MKRCSRCGLEKPEHEFSKNKQTKDGFSFWCKNCMYESQNVIQRKIRNKIESMKTHCQKCGESRVCVIEFHHINPIQKQFNIGRAASQHRSERSVLAEIDKCICLCSNCHKEYHHIYGVNPDNPVESLAEYLDGKRIVELLERK